MQSARFFVFVFLLFFGFTQVSQSQKKKPVRFERFTIEQGLSSNQIIKMTQDSKGYLWLGTDSGVSRFNGYEFKIYRNERGNPNSLISNRINDIYADNNDIIWIATQNGLCQYDPEQDLFSYDIGIPVATVFQIHESPGGDFWFGTDHGLFRYNPETKIASSLWEEDPANPGLKDQLVISLAEDMDGTIWIGTNEKGIYLLNPYTNLLTPFKELNFAGDSLPANKSVSKILVASNGEIWFGLIPDGGVGRYHPQNNTLKIYRNDPVKQPELWNTVSDIIETKDQTIWVSTFAGFNAGVNRLDKETDQFVLYTYDPNDAASLSWPYAICLFEDDFENLWVGTSRGLNKADINNWQMGHFSFSQEDPQDLTNNYYGIEEIKPDVFWLGLDGIGVIEWDRQHELTRHIDSILMPPGSTVAIQRDYDGSVWLAQTGFGLVHYFPQSGSSVLYEPDVKDSLSLPNALVNDLLLDRQNNLWISTNQGLSQYNRTRKNFTNWQKGPRNPGLTSNSMGALFEDSKGFIWIGSKRVVQARVNSRPEGLMRFDPNSQSFISFSRDPDDLNSLSSNQIYSINEDLKGNILIGTDNGLNVLNPENKEFTLYSEKDGLPDPTIIGILLDDSGIIWLSTLNGLSRFDSEKNTFRNYSTREGVQAPRFNENSFFKSDSGELFFGGVAGVNYFHPSEISGDQRIPVAEITQFLINNRPVQLNPSEDSSTPIKIHWQDNSIGFDFVSINFKSPEQTIYEYMLAGYDQDWTNIGNRRYVNFTNLNPGIYTFRVRVTNADGVHSAEDATFSFRILPPIWRTWYAYGLYGLILLLGILLIDRYQRRKLIRRENERNRDRELAQAKEIEKAYTELKATQSQLIQSEKMASLGELTAGIAHEIQNPLNFVNNFSEVSIELLDEMDEEIDAGNLEDVKDISANLKQNLGKINHHGKRADSIVKGMLQHSRSSDGRKEPMDINALADEYLRLSYHGLRAQDKSFNASMETAYDPELKEVMVVSQDIGRVLLNLLNNAFYAVTEKKLQAPADYEPTVAISTRQLKNTVEISIKDNGNGIPDSIREKIFNPFFTTKPTGKGTGLGLSMSFDIIAKGHQGELRVDTRDGEFTEFIIVLPNNPNQNENISS